MFPGGVVILPLVGSGPGGSNHDVTEATGLPRRSCCCSSMGPAHQSSWSAGLVADPCSVTMAGYLRYGSYSGGNWIRYSNVSSGFIPATEIA